MRKCYEFGIIWKNWSLYPQFFVYWFCL